MKKIFYKLIFLLILSSPFLFKLPINAVETVTSSEFFTIELTSQTQSPWSQRIPLVLKFRANRDAEKTELSWDAPTGVTIIEKHPQFVSVEKGQVYTYSALVDPETSGTYNIAANVTAWEVNTNYTSSSSITLKFDENLVQDPPASDYGTALLLKNIVFVIFGIVLVGIAAYGLKLGFGRLKEWLKPPE